MNYELTDVRVGDVITVMLERDEFHGEVFRVSPPNPIEDKWELTLTEGSGDKITIYFEKEIVGTEKYHLELDDW